MSDELRLSDLGPNLSDVSDDALCNELQRRCVGTAIVLLTSSGDDDETERFTWTGGKFTVIGMLESAKFRMLEMRPDDE